jgi:hypothetical protein
LGINSKSFINKPKNGTMKKVLFVLALGAFAACNDSGSSTDKKADTASTAPAPDTTKMKMDSGANKMSTDTTKKDTAVKK